MAVKLQQRGKRPGAQNQLLLAVFLSGVTIISLTAWVTRSLTRNGVGPQPIQAVQDFDAITIPVPVVAVPVGKRVRDIEFHLVSLPARQVPQGVLNSFGDIQDWTAATVLPANLPLFKDNFVPAVAANPVVERIPPGMRAMTLRVDATTAVEGWAGSGSVVDVLLVENDRTTVVAEKVKVLSAERSVTPVEGASAPSVPSTVTLLVTQEQCLAINTAIPRGKIAFALRSTKDEDTWQSTTFTAENLKGASASPEQKTTVTGYVEIKEENNTRSFALADGRWTRTSVIPEGFFPNAARNSAQMGRGAAE